MTASVPSDDADVGGGGPSSSGDPATPDAGGTAHRGYAYPDPGGYAYPDPGERLTQAMIADSGLTPRQWDEQESEVLAAVAAVLRALSPRRRLLDFGSGSGRLSIKFAELFDEVVSVEPDPARARLQSEAVARSIHRAKIRVALALPGPPTTDETYDCVILAYVIPHVTTAQALGILDIASGAIRPGGCLLLLTTLAGAGGQRFVVSAFDAAGRLVESEVSQAQFETACRQNQSGILPIRFFTYHDLLPTLAERRLRPVLAYGFHGPRGVVGLLPPPAADPGRGGAGPDLAACRDLAVLASKT